MNTTEKWLQAKPEVFWGEISPCDHVLQIYEDQSSFISLLAGFVRTGFDTGDAVIVIATVKHLDALQESLRKEGYDLFAMKLADQYIPIVAEDLLSQFMINGWPDEVLFRHTVSGLLNKARKKGRMVRAFGEMVALLWANGYNGATVQLEHLWTELCEVESFPVFCAYPRSGFTQDAHASVTNICNAHSLIVTQMREAPGEIFYQSIASNSPAA